MIDIATQHPTMRFECSPSAWSKKVAALQNFRRKGDQEQFAPCSKLLTFPVAPKTAARFGIARSLYRAVLNPESV